jgi:hypothetical protein
MSSNTKQKIQQMLYHLSTENLAMADKELKSIIKLKTDKLYNREYEKVKTTFNKEKL